MIHTISTLPSQGPVPIGFVLNRRRRLKLGIVFSIPRCTSFSVFPCSRNSGAYGTVIISGHPKFDFRSGFLFGYSELKFDTLLKPIKSQVGDLAPPLGWGLEEEAMGSELVEEHASSDEHLPVNGESESEGVNSSNSEGNGAEECRCKVDVRAVSMSLQAAKTLEDVEEILKDKGEFPLQVYSTMIRWFGKEKRMDTALILFDWMKKRKVESNGDFGPNLFIYNGLLGVVKQTGKFEEIDAILCEMEQDEITYNVVTYNTLMAIYIEKGECDKALNMLEEIQRNGVTPSPVSYSEALLAYRRMQDGYGALRSLLSLEKNIVEVK